MLLIAAARRLGEGLLDVREGRWKTWEPTRLPRPGFALAKRSGSIGMGRIGPALAKRCRAGWDMTILYYDVAPNPQAEKELDARQVGLDDLLRQSDFVSVHTALTPENRHLIGAAQFKLMKPTAVFVNTARGPLVDQKALYDALTSNTIFAAGLDVTDPEPPDRRRSAAAAAQRDRHAAHRQRRTYSTRNGMAEICADNLIAGLTGQPLRAWVNPEVAAKRRGG